MGYINLHAHSMYSDGVSTIKAIAEESKRLSFDACVITDHVYNRKSPYSLNEKTFQMEIEEAKRVSEEIEIPVILGIELSVNLMEEFCIFGTEAIWEILK